MCIHLANRECYLLRLTEIKSHLNTKPHELYMSDGMIDTM